MMGYLAMLMDISSVVVLMSYEFIEFIQSIPLLIDRILTARAGSATDATTAQIVIEATTTDVPNILISLRFRFVFFKIGMRSASFIF